MSSSAAQRRLAKISYDTNASRRQSYSQQQHVDRRHHRRRRRDKRSSQLWESPRVRCLTSIRGSRCEGDLGAAEVEADDLGRNTEAGTQGRISNQPAGQIVEHFYNFLRTRSAQLGTLAARWKRRPQARPGSLPRPPSSSSCARTAACRTATGAVASSTSYMERYSAWVA